MRNISKIATAAAVATAALGASAAAASAADISSIPAGSASYAYTSTPLAAGVTHKFQVGASGPTVSCTGASFSGATHNVAGNNAATDFQPTYSGCSFLGSATVTATNKWRLTATSTTAGTVTILPGSSVTIKALGGTCTVNVGAQGPLGGLTGSNTATSYLLSASVSGISYTSTGCPGVAASGTDAKYTTTAALNIPGVNVY